MSRTVKIAEFPVFPSEIPDGAAVVTLRSASTGSYTGPTYSLSRLAREIIEKKGFGRAPSLLSRHYLKQAAARAVRGGNASLASRVRNILGDILKNGIDPAALAGDPSPRVRELGLIAQTYVEKLRSAKLVDKEEVLRLAAGMQPMPRKLVIFGHHRALAEEIAFINAMAGDGSVYYLPCGEPGAFQANREAADRLAAEGWLIDSEIKPRALSNGEQAAQAFMQNLGTATPGLTAVAYPDLDQEIRGVMGHVKSLLIGGAHPDRIVLVTRDLETYSRAVAVIADEYGVRVNIGHKVPLGSTSFGGFIRLLLEALERDFRFEEAVRLVMHPLGPKITETQMINARKVKISGRDKWAELCPALLKLEAPDRAPLATWCLLLRTALRCLEVRERAALRTADWLAYSRFTDALDEVEKLESGRIDVTFEGFAGTVAEILSDEGTPLQPGSGGIRLEEPKSIVAGEFEHVFIMGLTEGRFPQNASEDPVIDFYDRRRLDREKDIHFATAAEIARWEELSFYFTLLTAKGTVSLSYPKILDNNEALPSPFLKRFGFTKVPHAEASKSVSSIEELRSAAILSNESYDDPALGDARRKYKVEFGRETAESYDEYDGVIGVPIDPATRTWSASQLVTLGQCSFGWFAKRLLKLAPPEEQADGLEANTLGSLYHKALEIAVGRAIGSENVRQQTLANLADAFAEAEKDPDVGLPPIANWESRRVAFLNNLRKAVESPEFVADGSIVQAVEQEFRTTWNGFTFTGSIDRVDLTPNGLVAVDYKTSSSTPKGAKDEWGKLSVDVQIPLYANVALAALYPEGELGDSSYYSLTKGKVLRREKKPVDKDKLEQLLERVRGVLTTGAFAVDPDEAEAACRYCEYEIVCRKGNRLRRKSRQ